MSKNNQPKSDPQWEEEAILETPTEQMDRITKAVTRFEMVNCLITLLAQECGLPKDSELKEILAGSTEVYRTYYKAMEEFKSMRSPGSPVKPYNYPTNAKE